MAKEKVEKEIITDIVEEFFMENGIEKTKRTFMSKDKVIKVEVVNS